MSGYWLFLEGLETDAESRTNQDSRLQTSWLDIHDTVTGTHDDLQWARARSKLPPWLPTLRAIQGYDQRQSTSPHFNPSGQGRARSAGNVASVGELGLAQHVLSETVTCEAVLPWTPVHWAVVSTLSVSSISTPMSSVAGDRGGENRIITHLLLSPHFKQKINLDNFCMKPSLNCTLESSFL